DADGGDQARPELQGAGAATAEPALLVHGRFQAPREASPLEAHDARPGEAPVVVAQLHLAVGPEQRERGPGGPLDALAVVAHLDVDRAQPRDVEGGAAGVDDPLPGLADAQLDGAVP